MLCCFAPALPAADGAGNYAIWGAGARSCNQFLLATADDDRQATFKHFLMGYLTAQNAVQDETYNTTGHMSLDKVLVWLNDYCDSHKLDSFEHAIVQFLAAHYDARLRRPPGAPSGWGNPASPTSESP